MKTMPLAICIATLWLALHSSTASAQTPIAKLLVSEQKPASFTEPLVFFSSSIGASQLMFIPGDGSVAKNVPNLFEWEYKAYGTYHAALVAGNSNGTDTSYIDITIAKSPPMPIFQAVSQCHE